MHVHRPSQEELTLSRAASDMGRQGPLDGTGLSIFTESGARVGKHMSAQGTRVRQNPGSIR